VLRGLLARRRKIDPDAPVIGTALGEISTSFKAALRRAELPDMRWHDLRHSFATWMATRCTFAALQQLLGHSPGVVTFDYLHVPFEELRDAVDTLPSLLAAAESKSAARG
jgi:integrase